MNIYFKGTIYNDFDWFIEQSTLLILNEITKEHVVYVYGSDFSQCEINKIKENVPKNIHFVKDAHKFTDITFDTQSIKFYRNTFDLFSVPDIFVASYVLEKIGVLKKHTSKNVIIEILNELIETVDFKQTKKAINTLKYLCASDLVTEKKNVKDIIGDAHALIDLKNNDYGNTFSELFQKYKKYYIVPRLTEKVKRLNRKSLNFESKQDTLIDIVSYCILTLKELKDERNVNIVSPVSIDIVSPVSIEFKKNTETYRDITY